MDVLNLLVELTPQAQVILLVCLLASILGVICLLLIIAFSRSATSNVCHLFTSIAYLLNHSPTSHIEKHTGFMVKKRFLRQKPDHNM